MSEVKNDLVVINYETKAVDIFQPEKIDEVIQKIKDEANKFKGDISSEKGRKEIASFAYKIARSKTFLDKLGKDLGEEARKQVDLINSERKKIKEELDIVQEQIRKPLTDWENKEKERVESHQREISTIEQSGKNIESGYLILEISEMEFALANLEKIDRDSEEFQEKANEAISIAKLRIQNAIVKRKERDREQAENARLKLEAEEKARKEREEMIAREAAEKARKEAELKSAREKAENEAKAKKEAELAEQKRLAEIAKVEAEKKRIEDEKSAVELEKVRAEERAKAAEQAKIEAEKRAVEAEERAKREKELAIKQEQDRFKRQAEEKAAQQLREIEIREANKRHVAKINNESLSCLVEICGLDKDSAKKVVVAIAKRDIKNVEIKY